MSNEVHLCEVKANRKGRDQSPCTLIIGHLDSEFVLLRTIDEGGVPPIVAVFDASAARELAKALLQAAEEVSQLG